MYIDTYTSFNRLKFNVDVFNKELVVNETEVRWNLDKSSSWYVLYTFIMHISFVSILLYCGNIFQLLSSFLLGTNLM